MSRPAVRGSFSASAALLPRSSGKVPRPMESRAIARVADRKAVAPKGHASGRANGQSKVSLGTTLASPIGRGVGSPNFARLRNARASPNAPAPRVSPSPSGEPEGAATRGATHNSPAFGDFARKAPRRGGKRNCRGVCKAITQPQTPPRRARWGDDFHWALGGLFSHNAPTGEARRGRLFFLCRFETR